ncbi:glycosyltransferase [Arhodomonas sp. AD133]|uniref:glycosyltransferase n=1 Tax=Arhodomonas sp. AD133 TaxID=3415009 RepID=UPI003EB8F957
MQFTYQDSAVAEEFTRNGSTLAQRRMSDRALAMFAYWSPAVPRWEPRKSANSTLRIAAIVSDHLYHGLRFEGELFLLTPSNWRSILDYGSPDLLIVESTWETATGHWSLAQCTFGGEAESLVELVNAFEKAGVPTAYWLTVDQVYHHHYKDFAKNFRKVFCADYREVGRLAAEGVKSTHLPPCVQPALYNPFRKHEYYDALELGVLFDGWGDLDRRPENFDFLKEVTRDHALDIVESRYQLTKRRLEAVDKELAPCIRGCVTRESRINVLKYAKAYISTERSLSTPTTQQWMALEAAASYLPIVHLGQLNRVDVRHNLVLAEETESGFLIELYRLKQDELYRKRQAHVAWRETYQSHTFSHRLRSICEQLNVSHDWEEYPKASLITPTYRKELLPRCYKTFERQSYPNKELVLVFNGNEPPTYQELGLDKPRKDVVLTYVPGEWFAGACLNMGHKRAEGKFFFRVDDDDYYGENYTLDLMLVQRSVDASRFGKPPCPFVFEKEPGVYLRRQIKMRRHTLSDGKNLAAGDMWIGGNSMSGSKRSFVEQDYHPSTIDGADTILNRNVAEDAVVLTSDDMNLVAERRVDLTTHTWQINAAPLKKDAVIYESIDELMV